jgi:archaemetzincin
MPTLFCRAVFKTNLFLICLTLTCCKYSNQKIGNTFKIQNKVNVIYIQPFVGAALNDVNYIALALKKICDTVVLLPYCILPSYALNTTKTRYRADTLIAYLSRNTNQNSTTIGLTSYDISTSKNNIADWGVMGLGYQPGNACIASTFRLKNKNKQVDLFKVAIHELGHTQGLPHCKNETCYMQDAKGGYPLNNEIDFCEDCKKVLTKLGWHFLIPCLGG